MSATPQNLINAFPCAQCGYDLRGTAVGGICPECGLPVLATRGGVRVEGNRLVIRSGATLPSRCIKTNEPVTAAPVGKTLSYASPWIYLLLLVNIIVLLIVYLIVRKQCFVTYSITPAVKNRIRMLNALALFTVLGGLAVLLVAAVNENGPIAVIGGVLFFAGLILAVIFSGPLSVAKHSNGDFWIKGCGPEFLQSIREETMGMTDLP